MESARQQLIKIIKERRRFAENAIFGEFILQTNEIQFVLSLLILLQSPFVDKKYRNDVEKATFGSIINLFCACSKEDKRIVGLIESLRGYKRQRDRLVHKMFTKEKLTPKECKLAIKKGKAILKTIHIILKEELSK